MSIPELSSKAAMMPKKNIKHRHTHISPDDYEFRFSNDLPGKRQLGSVNPAPHKSGCLELRDSTNSSIPVPSKENMLSGYQSSEELSDSVDEAETNSKDTEDLLRSYHSVYSESERPEVFAATENSHKTVLSSQETPAAKNFAGLKILVKFEIPTTEIPENHKIRLSDVSLRLLEEVDSRISAEMRLSSVKKDMAKPQSSFSCSKYFKVKKVENSVIPEECKENVPLGNRQIGQKLQATLESKPRKAPVLVETTYGDQSYADEDSEVMVDENGDLYGITCRSYRGGLTGHQQLHNPELQGSDGVWSKEGGILREIKQQNACKQSHQRHMSPQGRSQHEDQGCSLKSSIMSSQYNMMLSAEMLKREYQKFGCQHQQESAKWSLERNIPATEETTGSRGRKNSGPLPTSMPSSGKDTAPGVISGELEGWGSRSRCVSTDAGRQPSASRTKTKQTGSLSGVLAGGSTQQGTGGYYNSYRRNFRPGVSAAGPSSSQASSHSRDIKEKPLGKGCPAPRMKLWK